MDDPKCWKCQSSEIVLKKLRVGRLRTTALEIQEGKEDNNLYHKMWVCSKCLYQWFPHQDHYLKQIVFHTERNRKITNLALRFAKAKQTCFVYVERIEHSELLGLMIGSAMLNAGMSASKCIIVNGELEKAHNQAARKAIMAGEVLVAVGTSVWGEGTDIPSLRWVINAKAGKPGLELKQLVGRLMRKSKGKWRAGFVDFRDDHDPTFAKRSKARLKYLESDGHVVKTLHPIASLRNEQKYQV